MNFPRINKNQKRITTISLLLIVIALVTWLGYGGDILTKTEVLVEINDELYGTIKEWKDQFVLGLDYTLGIIGGITAITLPTLYLFRSKEA
ncbi:MAG: hypothetical protein KAI45_12090 [Melioribacteraceae bacterium]|nr:hypothetical protein [Melioribacteraceae bacterium]